MGLIRTTDATVEPVTLAEIKAQCRVSHNGEDDLLTSIGIAARQQCEDICHRAFISQTWQLRMNRFPVGEPIVLPRPRLISIGTFEYVDVNGDTQTLAEDTDYQVEIGNEPSRLYPAIDSEWPTDLNTTQIESVAIRYSAGFGTAATDVPRAIKQAILMLCSHWYTYREPVQMGSVVNIPYAVEHLLSPYIIRHFIPLGAVA